MRAWVFWIALKHERPRVAAGRARGPKCVRAYPRPPAFPPSGCRALPLVAGGGGRSKERRGTCEVVASKVKFGEASGESSF